MSDLMATVERLREAQELERLREENADLRRELERLRRAEEMRRQFAMMNAMMNATSAAPSSAYLAAMQGEMFGPSPWSKHMQTERSRLFGF